MQIIDLVNGSLTMELDSDMNLHESNNTGSVYNLEFDDKGNLVPISNVKNFKLPKSFTLKRDYIRKDSNERYTLEVVYDKHERFESWIRMYKYGSDTITFNEMLEVLLAEGPELFSLLKLISHESHDLFRQYTKIVQDSYTEEDSINCISISMDLSNSPCEFNSVYDKFIIKISTDTITCNLSKDIQISLLAFEEYIIRLEKYINTILKKSYFKDIYTDIVNDNDRFNVVFDNGDIKLITECRDSSPVKQIGFNTSSFKSSNMTKTIEDENKMLLDFIEDHSSKEGDPLGLLKYICGKKALKEMAVCE